MRPNHRKVSGILLILVLFMLFIFGESVAAAPKSVAVAPKSVAAAPKIVDVSPQLRVRIQIASGAELQSAAGSQSREQVYTRIYEQLREQVGEQLNPRYRESLADQITRSLFETLLPELERMLGPGINVPASPAPSPSPAPAPVPESPQPAQPQPTPQPAQPQPQIPTPQPSPPSSPSSPVIPVQPSPGSETPSGPSSILTSEETLMLNLINQERLRVGLNPLQPHAKLTELARLKAKDMIDNRYFAHHSPTYGSPFQMMSAAGIRYLNAGENLAGSPTVERAHTALMNSPGHRANILNRNYTHVGIGVVNGGVYGKMFVQMFIRPQ